MRKHWLALSTVAFVAGSFVLPSAAHHAASMFDRTQTIELSGEVVEFQWTSPHIWIQVNVENDAGEIEEWSVEGGVPNRLYRQGWRPNSFEPGDQVMIRGNPMRDGGKAVLFIGARLDDGSTLGRLE
ncbi:MAG: hypothetical protein GWN29_07480 [Gammaproteobacteria bacterium]|nr:hypothetical protein [Gammaproteobacteria bacterium]